MSPSISRAIKCFLLHSGRGVYSFLKVCMIGNVSYKSHLNIQEYHKLKL